MGARAVHFSTPRRAACAALRPQIRTQCLQSSRQFSVISALRAKRYSEDHEWVELSDDKKTITLGVSKYAADALGDVIYVELPQEGLETNAGDSIGAVECQVGQRHHHSSSRQSHRSEQCSRRQAKHI